MAQTPTPDLAVPYAAPKQVKTMAAVQPMAPKNGCNSHQYDISNVGRSGVGSRGWTFQPPEAHPATMVSLTE